MIYSTCGYEIVPVLFIDIAKLHHFSCTYTKIYFANTEYDLPPEIEINETYIVVDLRIETKIGKLTPCQYCVKVIV